MVTVVPAGMMIGFFAYTGYEPGDENVVLDSSLVSGAAEVDADKFSLQLFPNPASDNLNVNISVISNGYLFYDVYDINGSLLKSLHANNVSAGSHEITIPVNDLSAGMYLLKVQSAEGIATRKFLKE